MGVLMQERAGAWNCALGLERKCAFPLVDGYCHRNGQKCGKGITGVLVESAGSNNGGPNFLWCNAGSGIGCDVQRRFIQHFDDAILTQRSHVSCRRHTKHIGDAANQHNTQPLHNSCGTWGGAHARSCFHKVGLRPLIECNAGWRAHEPEQAQYACGFNCKAL